MSQVRMTAGLLPPTISYRMFDGSVSVLEFGKPQDYIRLEENPTALEIIGRWAKHLGVKKVYAPKSNQMNALVIDGTPENFIGPVISAHGVDFHFGAFVDGVRLTEPSAFFTASADCPTLVVRFKYGTVIAAHAARWSLLDQGLIITGKPTRAHEGVVQAIFDGCTQHPEEASAGLFCGIGAKWLDHSFDHPEHGEKNRQLVRYLRAMGSQIVLEPYKEGRIDFGALIHALLARCGMRHHRLIRDVADTFADERCGEPVWHSAKRGDKSRNGILVVRHF